MRTTSLPQKPTPCQPTAPSRFLSAYHTARKPCSMIEKMVAATELYPKYRGRRGAPSQRTDGLVSTSVDYGVLLPQLHPESYHARRQEMDRMTNPNAPKPFGTLQVSHVLEDACNSVVVGSEGVLAVEQGTVVMPPIHHRNSPQVPTTISFITTLQPLPSCVSNLSHRSVDDECNNNMNRRNKRKPVHFAAPTEDSLFTLSVASSLSSLNSKAVPTSHALHVDGDINSPAPTPEPITVEHPHHHDFSLKNPTSGEGVHSAPVAFKAVPPAILARLGTFVATTDDAWQRISHFMDLSRNIATHSRNLEPALHQLQENSYVIPRELAHILKQAQDVDKTFTVPNQRIGAWEQSVQCAVSLMDQLFRFVQVLFPPLDAVVQSTRATIHQALFLHDPEGLAQYKPPTVELCLSTSTSATLSRLTAQQQLRLGCIHRIRSEFDAVKVVRKGGDAAAAMTSQLERRGNGLMMRAVSYNMDEWRRIAVRQVFNCWRFSCKRLQENLASRRNALTRRCRPKQRIYFCW